MNIYIMCSKVGEVYSRTMMKGYLESKGIKLSEHKVGSALQQVAPESYERDARMQWRKLIQYLIFWPQDLFRSE